MSPEVVVVVGLGYAGLPIALVLAEAGWQVVGVDVDPVRVRMLRKQLYADGEAIASELLAKHLGRGLTITSTLPKGARAYVITVATPVDEDGMPNLDDLKRACEQVGSALEVGSLVVLRSTVPPGTTRHIVAPLLARTAGGLHPGVDFHLVYAPERAVQGAAIQELRRLPQLLAGLSDEACFVAARDVFSFATSILRAPSLESAEFAKLLNNAFRGVSFAFANMAAKLVSGLGLDAPATIALANFGYPRNPIAMPSPGVGGPCLKKDSAMLGHVAEALDVEGGLLDAARRLNDSMPEFVVEQVSSEVAASGLAPYQTRVLVCGMAFKGNPETADMRESAGVRIAQLLVDRGMSVCIHDPVVPATAMASLKIGLTSLIEGLRWADVVVLANNHTEYASLGWSEVPLPAKPGVVWLDLWSLHRGSPLAADSSVRYRTLGGRTSGIDFLCELRPGQSHGLQAVADESASRACSRYRRR